MILDEGLPFEHFTISFIDGPLFKVKSELSELIFPSLNKNWQVDQYELSDYSQLLFVTLQPYSEVVKCLMWQPESIDRDLLIFFTNMPDGWITLINKYNRTFQRSIIQVTFSNSSKVYPKYKFEYLGLGNKRLIQLIKDSDEWDFFQEGPILNFEDIGYYKKNKVKDRFNNEIIEEYLKKNRIDINEPGIWKSRGMAFEFSSNLIQDL